VKKAKNILFVISKPDVFKSPASETYVIFGEAKIEDMTQAMHAAAAEQFKNTPQQPGVVYNTPSAASATTATDTAKDTTTTTAPTTTNTTAAAAADDSTDDANLDETGLDADEIQTVMNQASVSRAKAVKALRKNKNIVDAILELTP